MKGEGEDKMGVKLREGVVCRWSTSVSVSQLIT